MLLFTAIFVFNKLTILQGIAQKKFPVVPIWLFHVNRIETQNDNVCLPFCWSWSGGWKRGANRIREHWFWGFRYLVHTSKCTFMSWLLDSLDLPSRRKDTHRLMSRVDYGSNQWSVVRFVIKKLYVYLFMVKQCIYLVIMMHFMQICVHLLWSGNKFTDFVELRNFLSTLHATWIIKKSEILRKLNGQDKTQFENKRHKFDY